MSPSDNLCRVKETLQRQRNTKDSKRAGQNPEGNGGLFHGNWGNTLNVSPRPEEFPHLCSWEWFWGSPPSRLSDPSSLPILFPMLLHFLQGLAGVGGTLVSRIHVGFLYGDQSLFYVVLHGTHGGADGLAAEPMGNQAEVGQAVLNGRLQDRRRPIVPVGCSVLVEKVRELFTHLPMKTTHTCELRPGLDRSSPIT